jgi:hypothetical protein
MNRYHMRFAGAIILIGMSLVILTHLFRPMINLFTPPFIILVIGVLPNFGAALSLPYVIGVLAKVIFHTRDIGLRDMFIFASITFTGLFIWEIAQYIIWNIPIDPNDIATSGIGVIVALCLYFIFIQKKKILVLPIVR